LSIITNSFRITGTSNWRFWFIVASISLSNSIKNAESRWFSFYCL